MFRPLALVITILCFPILLIAQLSIHVQSVSSNTPYGASIFIAGNFNDWTSGDPNFQMQANELGVLEIDLDIPPGSVQFKFTRGSWDTVEGSADGSFIQNRLYEYSGGLDTIFLNIAGWEGQNPGGNSGTAAVNVSVLSEQFPMPELDRSRRIWIYLPPDYAVSTKRYPVLYMHDAQNLFDRTLSFSGEWEVDESLNRLFAEGDPGIIVVGIDNGGSHRIDEYTPWTNPEYGGGQGEAYTDFIVETLKPYIDENYRTKPEQPHTGILGSSLGGLISLYAGIEYQDVFGKVGVFSPSLWFSSSAYVHVSEQAKQNDVRFYLLAGAQESETMAPDLMALYNNLLSAGFQSDEIQMLIQPDGQHSEWFWAREFPAAYLWLFAEETPTSVASQLFPIIKLSPNPATNEIRIEGTQVLNQPNIQVFSVDGKPISPPTILQGVAFNSSFLKAGTYLFIIRDGAQIVGGKKMVIAGK